MRSLTTFITAASFALVSSFSMAESLPVGDDLYAMDENIVTQTGNDDVFAMANSISINHPVGGSAHIIGRHLNINAPIAHNLYMGGENITLQEPVSQDVLAVGTSIQINSNIAGELRALGESITVYGDVAGDAAIGGDTVHLEGVIGGDLDIGAMQLSFGENAEVAGTITIYEDEDRTTDIPSHIADSSRIVRVPMAMEDMHEYGMDYRHYGQADWKDWLSTVLTLALLGFAAALIARQFMARVARKAQDNKGTIILQGALGLAIMIGAIPLFAITLIGMPVSFILVILTIILVFVGWIVGSYAVGQIAWQRLRGETPSSVLALALTALLGAVLVTTLAAVPFVGWLIGLAAVLFGIGAISPWQTRRYH